MKKELPMIEREPEEIRQAFADFFALDPEDVRVTKLQLSEGRSVAYIRAVWTSRPKEKRRG